MLAAVAIVLLEQYASGFLEGIGLKEKAKQQGKKARDWLSRLRTGALTNDELDAARGDAADAVASIRSEKANAAGITSGERATQEFLKEVGAPPSRARALAAELTALVTGDDRDHGTSG